MQYIYGLFFLSFYISQQLFIINSKGIIYFRSVAAAKMALLVPKGIQFFPDSQDRVSGFIDVW
jgi:hypothetical protein